MKVLEELGFKTLPMMTAFQNMYLRNSVLNSLEITTKGQDIEEYLDLITQPLALWQFVPCNEEGNVLVKPKSYKQYLEGGNLYNDCEEYQKALGRVLFEESEWSKNKLHIAIDSFNWTIENAINNNVKLTLKK